MRFETPAVRRFDQAWGPGQQQKGFGSVLLYCRRAEEKELPSALCAGGWSGLGCTWWMLELVGSMLVGCTTLGGLVGWWAGLVVRPPGALVVEVPAVYRWCPLHTWAHLGTPKVGMFQRTCRSGSLGKGAAAGEVRGQVAYAYCGIYLLGGLHRLPSQWSCGNPGSEIERVGWTMEATCARLGGCSTCLDAILFLRRPLVLDPKLPPSRQSVISVFYHRLHYLHHHHLLLLSLSSLRLRLRLCLIPSDHPHFASCTQSKAITITITLIATS